MCYHYSMDDTAQQPMVQQPVDQTQQSAVPQPVTQQTQSVSVPAGKETAPATVTPPKEQWVVENAPQAEVPQELKDVGVEAPKEEKIELHPDVANAGVVPTGTAAPIPEESTIKLPMTEEQATKILAKHGKVKLSVAWFAMLVLRQIKVLQFNKTKEKKK